MFCSKCGVELPEGAQFCHACGNKIDGIVSVETEKNETIETVVPKIEYKFQKKNKMYMWLCFILLFISLVFCIPQGVFLFACIIIVILSSEGSEKAKARNINRNNGYFSANGGNKIPWTCPYCGSPDYSSFVETRTISSTSNKARVSDNINPLHPFTHTNISNNSSTVSSNISVGKLQCHRCGKVFE